MMRLRLVQIISVLAIATYSAIAQQTEQPLSITGDLISGYTGQSNAGVLDSGPYVGFNALATGYWKDPRIFSFSAGPNFGRGITHDGVMSGPFGEGISSNATVLGGSRAPLTLTYDYQFSPGPDVNNRVSPDFQGFSLTRKVFGAEWDTNFRHLPPISVSYTKSSDESEGGGTSSDNNNRDFRVQTHFNALTWRFSGNYLNSHGESGAGAASSSAGDLFTARNESQSANGTALHDLPLHSKILLEGGWTDVDLDVAGALSNNQYTHGGASITSQPIRRLSVDMHANYLSDMGSFLRTQLLTSQVPSDVAPSLATITGRETVTYGTGASFTILTGLAVNGNYNATQGLSSEGGALLGDGHGIGAGIAFNHSLKGGEFFASYNHSMSTSDVPVDLTSNVLSTNESTSDTAVAGYSHRLPYGINASGAVNYNITQIDYTAHDDLRSWGLNLQARRPVATGWNLSGVFTMRTGSHIYPAFQEDGSKSGSVSLESKRLQLTGSYTRTYGLAYLFGSRIIFVPGSSQFSELPGLPLLSESNSSFFNVTAGYKVTRRLTVNAGYYRGGASTSNSAFGDTMHGFDVRGQYRFRQIWLVAGYRRDMRGVETNSTSSFAGQSFYVMMRRHFTLF